MECYRNITTNEIVNEDEAVELIIGQYGYKSTSEIKIKDYMNIVNDFKANK